MQRNIMMVLEIGMRGENKSTYNSLEKTCAGLAVVIRKYSPTPPHQHCPDTPSSPCPKYDKCISGRWTLNSCVFSLWASAPTGVHMWVMATGWPDTPWQTRPWAVRTNAMAPHSAHYAAAQNTAIGYRSRQLCLRTGIHKSELAFYHTHASQRNDKRVTDLITIQLRHRPLGTFRILCCDNTRPQDNLDVLGINLILKWLEYARSSCLRFVFLRNKSVPCWLHLQTK